MIHVEGLTRTFGDRVAVRDLTFHAERGEIIGLLGPNGAGKTTTMRVLTGLLPPTRGRVRVAGFDVVEQSLEVRRRVGYLPETVPLWGDLTVRELLEFVAALKAVPPANRRERIDAALASCGVADVADRRIDTLSRGYRQRAGIAQALVGDPEVLVLDEPTVGLDPRQIVEIRELIRSLAPERTVILSTHILPEVTRVCRRVLIIDRGVLVTDDTPERLGRATATAARLAVTVRGPRSHAAEVLRALDAVESVSVTTSTGDVHHVDVTVAPGHDRREAVAAAIVRADLGLLALSTREPTLEDVFVQLVTEEPGA